ncbi:MAG: hypothetical protein J6X43_09330 [Bacteroidales bacterium]|nr:hypothetical protein [Bacteroidales bacterium]
MTTLTQSIIDNLAQFDPEIGTIKPLYGDPRKGDIKNSLASIEKARRILHYEPEIFVKEGIALTTKWFYEKIKKQ